jgi:uncharacterized protein (TIGR02646 family)
MVELDHQDVHKAPPELSQLDQQQPVRPWQDLQGDPKNLLKKCLTDEQYGLCAYCERRLVTGGGRVDHIKSRHGHPHLTFSYSNLCVSCFGYYEEEGKRSKLSCDEAKGSISLGRVEPRPNVNRLINFDPASGRLGCALPHNDPDYQHIKDTIESIGLQNVYLCNLRKRRYQALLGSLMLGADPLMCIEKSDDFYWTLSEYFRSP